MNILYFTTWFPNKDNNHSGIFILEHAKACKSVGINVKVIFISITHSSKLFQKTYKEYIVDGIKVYKYEIKSLIWKWVYINPFLWRYIGKWVFLKKVKPDFQPDIIHSHVTFPALIIGDNIAKKFNIPQVLTEHWSGLHNYLTKNIFSFLARNAYKRVSKIIVVSDFLKTQLKQEISNSNIETIPNIVSDDFQFIPFCTNRNEISFTCIGNWKLPKRLDLIIGSLNTFAGQIKKTIKLNVIGNGRQLNDIRGFNFSSYLKVEFYGNKTRTGIKEIFKDTDYFIHASNYETFSIVVAEALKCGIPVIASKAGAIPEIIDKDCGILVQNSIEAFNQGLQELISKSWDRNQIAKKFETKYSYTRIGEMHKAIYQKIL